MTIRTGLGIRRQRIISYNSYNAVILVKDIGPAGLSGWSEPAVKTVP
jgi:hypothetical protein